MRGVLFSILVLAWSVGQVRAADISWNTGNGTWNTLELNWTGDTNRFTDGGVDNVSFLGSGGGTVTVDIGMTPLSTIVDNDSGTYAFQGVAGSIDGGSLTKDGSGELELNTAHLMTNVTFVLHAGLLDLNTVQQVDSFSRTGGLLQYQGAGLIIGSNHTDTHWQGSTAGNGFLTKVGTGVFTFSGIGANNSFSAGLNISEGTFRIGAPNRIADATSVFITGRGILDLNGFDETVRQLRLEGGCTIRGNGGCLTLTQASRPFGGISGGASDLALVASDVHFSAGDPILLDVRNNDLGDGITQVFDGAISGAAGGLSLTGNHSAQAVIRFMGANPNAFTGALTWDKSTLELAKTAGTTAVPGDLTVGSVFGPVHTRPSICPHNPQEAEALPE